LYFGKTPQSSNTDTAPDSWYTQPNDRFYSPTPLFQLGGYFLLEQIFKSISKTCHLFIIPRFTLQKSNNSQVFYTSFTDNQKHAQAVYLNKPNQTHNQKATPLTQSLNR
jgi:hypothetical protein